MRIFWSIFFLTVILSAALDNAVGYLAFKINQDYIANNLCINKVKFVSCQGKCYLEKQITAKNKKEQESKSPSPKQDKEQRLYVKTDLIRITHFNHTSAQSECPSINQDLKHNSFKPSIFHPPKS